jgi:hypothetical protein
MTDTDSITWLMNWYQAQCNEDWEHSFGVLIDTLDNPGWSLTIDLNETALLGKPFTPVYENIDPADAMQGLDGDIHWIVAEVKGTKFWAIGGPRDLMRLIEIFRAWACEP